MGALPEAVYHAWPDIPFTGNFYVGGCARKAVESGIRTVPGEAKHWLWFWRRQKENSKIRLIQWDMKLARVLLWA